ncbi:glycosyltransferase family 1 protein [Gordonia sp. ABSL49_1]|uniref:glycosyltransferase family 1 protein n=1 Tax=Gordonia sp. ABSL49_1 TaxID=2920941 RepID=UPI001F0FC221|nr:glycosyltransferase family 1 protein [Gordonia sp. ABSL49_1]MCH5641230.1 glycosyltransferase family 1 protein [Gordonia sp. ABSL49_1]
MFNTQVRVASVPSSHVYVRHLSTPDASSQVTRLPDPVPADGRKVPGGWWPPVMLDPDWIARHHDDFDLMHVHFGFDAIGPDTMRAIVDELERHGKPLVYTLHDLRNPHHPTPGDHEKVLDVLVPAATELVTLTPGAAEVIERRWSRTASVLPHPHVVPRVRFPASPTVGEEFVVGVHAKSVRPNMDPLPVISTLTDAAASYPDVVIQVNLHSEVFEPGSHWYNPEFGSAALSLGGRPATRVVVHDYFSDDELWDYLESLAVSVLPYRFGTHSGWLEACHDLGTAVIAPSCGFYRDQRECELFDFTEDRYDAESLVQALDRSYRRVPTPPTWTQRRSERAWIAAEHDRLYARCLDA